MHQFKNKIRIFARNHMRIALKVFRLSRERLKAIKNGAKVVIPMAVTCFAKKHSGSIWIITELNNQARDNGLCFFRYLRTQHPEQPVYYIIDQDAKDRIKVARYGNVVNFNSWKHYYYFCLSTVHISSYVGGCFPKGNPYIRRLKKKLKYTDVFLPHGVSYGITEYCAAERADIDLFFSCTSMEYENLIRNYGYTDSQVILTGFPRMDGWYCFKKNNKQILLMPTWRSYIALNHEIRFEETKYYLTYQTLLDNPELHAFLKNNGLKLVFYFHHEMQKFAGFFHSDCFNIEVVYNEANYDIQELLKKSALMITDYSSVHFDFAYMDKPVIYYQFDEEEFFTNHFQHGPFDVLRDGFGPVVKDLNQLITELEKSFEFDFIVLPEYKQRTEHFFPFRDQNNSDRVYAEIIKRTL